MVTVRVVHQGPPLCTGDGVPDNRQVWACHWRRQVKEWGTSGTASHELFFVRVVNVIHCIRFLVRHFFMKLKLLGFINYMPFVLNKQILQMTLV